MYLLTNKAHAQLMEALKAAGALNHQRHCGYKTTEITEHIFIELNTKALTTLQSAPEVEVVGKVTDTTATDFLVEFNKLISIDKSLYATKDKT